MPCDTMSRLDVVDVNGVQSKKPFSEQGEDKIWIFDQILFACRITDWSRGLFLLKFA